MIELSKVYKAKRKVGQFMQYTVFHLSQIPVAVTVDDGSFWIKEGDRFLNDNAIRVAVGRRDAFGGSRSDHRITKKLWIDSVYELRLSSADPESRSRVINSLQVSLNYAVRSYLRVGLDYQGAIADFTSRDRTDQYHRVLGSVKYSINRRNQVSIQAGLSSGSSTESKIDFGNLFLSVTYTLEVFEFK